MMATRADVSNACLWDALRSLPDSATDADIRAAIRDAYPFGERKYHPYKVWLRQAKIVRATWEKMGSPRYVTTAPPIESQPVAPRGAGDTSNE